MSMKNPNDTIGNQTHDLPAFSTVLNKLCHHVMKQPYLLRMFARGSLHFGVDYDELLDEWRRLHNAKLHDLYSSPNIIKVSISRRMR